MMATDKNGKLSADFKLSYEADTIRSALAEKFWDGADWLNAVPDQELVEKFNDLMLDKLNYDDEAFESVIERMSDEYEEQH